MIAKSGLNLAAKMTLLILGGTLIVFVLTLGENYLSSRDLIFLDAEVNAQNLAGSMANRIEQEFRAVAKVPEAMAVVLENTNPDKATLLDLLSRFVEENREIFGSTVAYEPYAFDPGLKTWAPYFYRSDNGIGFIQLGSGDYDYFQWDWYKVPLERKTRLWSEPFYDEGGGDILMCTYSVPFYAHPWTDSAGKVRGIVTADISLAWLTRFVDSIQAGAADFGFLISKKGTFITYPDGALIMKKSIFDLARERGDQALDELGRDMMRGNSGFVEIHSLIAGAPAFVAYTHIPSTNWSLAVVFDRGKLLAELHELNHRVLLIALIGLALLFFIVLFISRSIARPVRKMAEATTKMAAGDLDIDLTDLETGDEVGRLAQAFSRMTKDLKQHIHDLTETTAAKERIESELNIASQIQKSILPSTFPPFPDYKEFDLYAIMRPARQVGGDFFDFFFIDEDRLALVMADVSDKGVPAALFMMVSRTLLKSIAGRKKNPVDVLAEVNNLLCQGNEAGMFVTVFLGYYEIGTGEISYAVGGHNPAIIMDAGGNCRLFERKKGVALGFVPDVVYEEGREKLKRGETLVLYTDGVTEAFSPDKEMFGEQGFINLLGRNHTLPLPDVCHQIEISLEAFQEGNQFDDITVMMLRRLI